MVSVKSILAGILLLIPFIVYFAIPTYNKAEPDLGGLPFFYWYQTLWLVISTILFSIAALLLARR
ncbi:DUF3311 domain-containing protein [Saccharolobus shibatae]|uniref:DUF3311 domain-containing protein n=1 Tax=Saccharolobus shibatae TaxID=2286 RepID=A0A8F5GW53_9CREN|nr:DUF3311 domain-containing protein [Saccharolobus shibatae]QXJ31724.1 hypothetical protein J5U21_01375 [Saccharolobus shibatae]